MSRDWDIEAADTGATGLTEGTMLEPTDIVKEPSHCVQSKDKDPDVHPLESHHITAERDRQSPPHHGLAAATINKDSIPRLLSDAENERMNMKIDRLIAAIDDRRHIHFEPDAQTGEVQIFADREVTGQDDDHEKSPNSLQYAESDESWASTIWDSISSKAWQREIEAANVRYALANGGVDLIETPVKHPFRFWPVEETRQYRSLLRDVSPIPLDFHTPLRTSTPSIYSNGSELDTSSPLFGKSCERILRDTYAQPPESTFQRESVEYSQLDDLASIAEPCDAPSPEACEANAFDSARRAFGVFQDDLNGVSVSKITDRSTTRSKVLKDISNLRRPGYLQFNSFAKDAKSATNQVVTATTGLEPLVDFEGASGLESRRIYISKRWPMLLDDRGNGSSLELPRLDGAARRRNEQEIGRPIDTSLYALSHVRTSETKSPLAVSPTRQAHFDLALARLEGRALPPPPSPIHRYPDWAAIYDRDIRIEGGYRPLPIFGPMPSKHADPTMRRGWWRNSR